MKILELKIEKLFKKPIKNEADLASFKRKLAREIGMKCLSNVELLKTYHKY
jgi:hypothetical protein